MHTFRADILAEKVYVAALARMLAEGQRQLPDLLLDELAEEALRAARRFVVVLQRHDRLTGEPTYSGLPNAD